MFAFIASTFAQQTQVLNIIKQVNPHGLNTNSQKSVQSAYFDDFTGAPSTTTINVDGNTDSEPNGLDWSGG